MRSMKRSAFAALVGCGLVALSGRTDRDVAIAQQRAPIVMTRMFTGPDGQSHTEEIELNLKGAGADGLSEMFKASSVQFRRTPPNYNVDWHHAPRRQFVITLSGRGEDEVAGGRKIALVPGHIMLAEDLSGKGHISRGVGSEDRISVVIPLAD
jgi:hypothetical protein